MHDDARRLDEITEKVIGCACCAFSVANALGPGFLEKVYENALAVELRRCGLQFDQQKAVHVMYRGVIVGDYIADLLVEGSALVELKTVAAVDPVHVAQGLDVHRRFQ